MQSTRGGLFYRPVTYRIPIISFSEVLIEKNTIHVVPTYIFGDLKLIAKRRPESTEELYNLAKLLWKQTIVGVDFFQDPYYIKFPNTKSIDMANHQLSTEDKFKQQVFSLYLFMESGDYKKSLLYIREIEKELDFENNNKALKKQIDAFFNKLDIKSSVLNELKEEINRYELTLSQLKEKLLKTLQPGSHLAQNNFLIGREVKEITAEINGVKECLFKSKIVLLRESELHWDYQLEKSKLKRNGSPLTPTFKFRSLATTSPTVMQRSLPPKSKSH